MTRKFKIGIFDDEGKFISSIKIITGEETTDL